MKLLMVHTLHTIPLKVILKGLFSGVTWVIDTRADCNFAALKSREPPDASIIGLPHFAGIPSAPSRLPPGAVRPFRPNSATVGRQQSPVLATVAEFGNSRRFRRQIAENGDYSLQCGQAITV